MPQENDWKFTLTPSSVERTTSLREHPLLQPPVTCRDKARGCRQGLPLHAAMRHGTGSVIAILTEHWQCRRDEDEVSNASSPVAVVLGIILPATRTT